MPGRGVRGERVQLRSWERFATAVFGLFVAGAGDEAGQPWGPALVIGGCLIIAAGIGLVDVLMAVYHRSQRHRRLRGRLRQPASRRRAL